MENKVNVTRFKFNTSTIINDRIFFVKAARPVFAQKFLKLSFL